MMTRTRERLFLIILVVTSLLTFFYQLGSLFSKMVSDEQSFLMEADFLKDYPYYPYLILPNGLGTTHTFLIYLMVLSLRVFGYTLFGLRFFPALFGFLGVFLMYRLVKNLTQSSQKALIAGFVLSVTSWYLSVSRVAVEVSEYIFFSLLCVFFLTLFISVKDERVSVLSKQISKSSLYLFLCGLSFGLLQNTYQSARFIIFFLVAFFILYWISNKTKVSDIFRHILFFSIGSLLTLAPLIYVYIMHRESFDSRSTELVFNQNLPLKTLVWSIKESVVRTLGMFHFVGYDVSCYNLPRKPMLDIFSGIFMVLGAVASLRAFSKNQKILFYSFFITSLLPSFLSYWPATPHGLRGAAVLIPTVIFVTLGIDWLGKVFREKKYYFVVTMIVIISFLNLKTYFWDLSQIQFDCFRFEVGDLKEFEDHFLESTKGVRFIR